MSQEEWSIFWEVTVSIILNTKKSIYTHKYTIPNAFRDFHSTVAKLFIRKILCSVSNASIYCSSDKVGTVYLVKYIFQNSTANINVSCNSCEDTVCCNLTLFYASNNPHHVTKQFVSCIHFTSVHFSLVIHLHKQTSNGIWSGHLGGHVRSTD